MTAKTKTKHLGEFTNAELAAGRAALAALIGAEAAGELGWLRRLVLVEDGLRPPTWEMDVRSTHPSYTGEPLESRGIRTLRKSLVHGIGYIRAGREDEADQVEEARAKRAAASAAEQAAKEERDQREREENRRKAAELEARVEAFGGREWEKLNPWQRLIYRLALVEAEHGSAEKAAALRTVAEESHRVSVADAARGPEWPGREWRR